MLNTHLSPTRCYPSPVLALDTIAGEGAFLREDHMDKPTTKELAHFLTHVNITKSCWLWIGCLNKKGYGYFWYRGKNIKAHRFSYRMFVAPTESDKQILHRRECGNRNCVNPHHLYMGTNDDNIRDKILWGKSDIGENHWNAKLSKGDVLTIREIHKDKKGGYKYTADIFGVDQTLISRIVRRTIWKHV